MRASASEAPRRDRPWPALAAGLAGLALTLSTAWHGVELRGFDALCVATAPGEAPLPITVIAVDEESMAALGRQWPWPRSVHARLLDRLRDAGVAVVAFDIVFAEADPTPAEDEAFAAAIRRFGRVVLASNLEYRETRHARQWVRSDPRRELLEAGAVAGLATVRTDADGVLRDIPTSQGAFWLEVVASFDRVRPGIARGLSVSGSHRIRYLGPPGTFTTISYHRMLDPERQLSPNWREVLRDNIVLVGRGLKTTAELSAVEADMFLTPFFRPSGQLMPGVEVQANIVANMILGEPLREAHPALPALLVAATTALAALAMRAWHPWKSGAWALALAAAVVALDAAIFHYARLWVPAGASLATVALAYAGQGARGYLAEQARRQALRRAFARYVSPAVVDEIAADPAMLKLGGQRRELTLLFSDLRDFTGISEALPAEEVARVLNRHLSEMTEIVIRHGGTVDKFIGDSVMAFWGAPLDDPGQSAHALDAALEMQAAVAALRAQEAAHAGPALHMRVGLHRGECIVGNLGGNLRFEYTAIGDSVNVAARIEGVNKVYGTGILLSEDVARHIPGRCLRPVDTVRVKGRRNAVEIFTPCEDAALATRAGEALAAYRAGDWVQALALWEGLARDYPGDGIAAVFVDRLRAWSAGGWPQPWDGITDLDSK